MEAIPGNHSDKTNTASLATSASSATSSKAATKPPPTASVPGRQLSTRIEIELDWQKLNTFNVQKLLSEHYAKLAAETTTTTDTTPTEGAQLTEAATPFGSSNFFNDLANKWTKKEKQPDSKSNQQTSDQPAPEIDNEEGVDVDEWYDSDDSFIDDSEEVYVRGEIPSIASMDNVDADFFIFRGTNIDGAINDSDFTDVPSPKRKQVNGENSRKRGKRSKDDTPAPDVKVEDKKIADAPKRQRQRKTVTTTKPASSEAPSDAKSPLPILSDSSLDLNTSKDKHQAQKDDQSKNIEPVQTNNQNEEFEQELQELASSVKHAFARVTVKINERDLPPIDLRDALATFGTIASRSNYGQLTNQHLDHLSFLPRDVEPRKLVQRSMLGKVESDRETKKLELRAEIKAIYDKLLIEFQKHPPAPPPPSNAIKDELPDTQGINQAQPFSSPLLNSGTQEQASASDILTSEAESETMMATRNPDAPSGEKDIKIVPPPERTIKPWSDLCDQLYYDLIDLTSKSLTMRITLGNRGHRTPEGEKRQINQDIRQLFTQLCPPELSLQPPDLPKIYRNICKRKGSEPIKIAERAKRKEHGNSNIDANKKPKKALLSTDNTTTTTTTTTNNNNNNHNNSSNNLFSSSQTDDSDFEVRVPRINNLIIPTSTEQAKLDS